MSEQDHDLTRELAAAVRAAKIAGEILLDRRGKVTVERKGGHRDLVTEADRMAEEAVNEVLLGAFPEYGIVGEETGETIGSDGHRWFVDPLDGTTNYAQGLPLFATSIALEKDGELLVGVIHLPVLGETYTAVRGRGAWCNGHPLHVSSEDKLENALLVTGFPYDMAPGRPDNMDHILALVPQSRGVRLLGAAAIDLVYVAAGMFEAYWDLNNAPWDVAAGVLLVEEAGGKVTDMNGGPLDLFNPRMLASNGRLHDRLLGVFGEGKID